MRRRAVLTLALAALLPLAGCATGGAPQRKALAGPVHDGIPLDALPRQDLGTGQCALFIWKAGNEARLVLMARTDPQVARISLKGRPIDLARSDAPADPSGATFADAHYANGGVKVALAVTLEQRSALQGGAVVTGGILQLDLPGGESFVMPVAGLLACR